MTARGVGRIACMLLLVAICLPLLGISRLFGGGDGVIRFFHGRVGWLLGLRVTVEGRPIAGNVLYASNHISWLDIPAIGGTAPARFIAKSEIERWPVVGWLAKVGGSVFVARQRRSEARVQADAISLALGQGRPMVLFAEAGTSDGITLMPFRASLFASAREAAVTVQPVAIDYGARAPEIAWPHNARFSSEVKRMLNRPAPVDVTLRFLQPIDSAHIDRKRLAIQAQVAVEEALGMA